MLLTSVMFAACFSGKTMSMAGRGGEVVGVGGGRAFNEPAPYGMVKVDRGFLHMGIDKQDSLWGRKMPVKDISVDGFWMDETEVTNAKYKQFVMWVRDSILRTRLADPAYGGDETYLIIEDKKGEFVKPRLNWKKPLPRVASPLPAPKWATAMCWNNCTNAAGLSAAKPRGISCA